MIHTLDDDINTAIAWREIEKASAERMLFGSPLTEELVKERIKQAVEDLSEEEREELRKLFKERYDTD